MEEQSGCGWRLLYLARQSNALVSVGQLFFLAGWTYYILINVWSYSWRVIYLIKAGGVFNLDTDCR